MSVTIKLKGSGELIAKLDKIERELFTKKMMGRIAAKAVQLIHERTTGKNRDKFGRPFKKYSPKYRAAKAELREGRGFTGNVDLQLSNDMMNHLTFYVQGVDRAYLHWPRPKDNIKAVGHVNGPGGLPKRDFFGLTSAEELELMTIPTKYLRKVINERS